MDGCAEFRNHRKTPHMAIAKHCGVLATQNERGVIWAGATPRLQGKLPSTTQRTNRPSPGAGTRQVPGTASGHAAQGKNPRRPRLPNHGGPLGRTQAGAPRVAGGGKYRGQENRPGTGAARPPHVRHGMGGTGNTTPPPQIGRRHAGPAPAAQMHARTQCMGKPDIPGNHQHKAVGPADPRQGTPDRGPIRRIIMPKHHPTQAFGQPGRRNQRVHPTRCIRKQP